MQTSSRRKTEKPRSRELTKDELPLSSRKVDEKLLKDVSTPRNYLQRTTPSDIYGKKKPNVLQTPKKSSTKPVNTAKNVSPMKGLLKSTPSSVSQGSVRSSAKMTLDNNKKSEAKTIALSRKSTPRVVKAQANTNVTVNSPVVKRKLNLTKDKSNTSIDCKINDATKTKTVTPENAGKISNMADIFTRQRSKTRTLDESEVKVFKPDVVDNNAEMKNLSRRLSAKPKSFYVDLNEGQSKVEKERSSEEEVSYEDDFESYESDFDSYHSESQSGAESSTTDEGTSEEKSEKINVESETEENQSKDAKDEEKMLDSGSYDLRETQRSAQRNKPAVLDFILEGTEEGEKRSSLTDEGFQDMSTSSAVSSIKTLHIDVLDRPLFVDFTSCKINRKKRRIFEQLRRRADDILSMVTLHEMKFTLFEMKPVPYEIYMAAFGRSDCAQVSVQTLDDAIAVEVQTDEVASDTKWTQCPIKFSKHDICLGAEKIKSDTSEDLVTRFSVLLNPMNTVSDGVGDRTYGEDPLRILLDQKNGVGSDAILPHGAYSAKLNSVDFNVKRLKKFLNRTESRISRILSANAGNLDVSGVIRTKKFPFSDSYVTVPIQKANSPFIEDTKVSNVIVSETRSHFIITVHEKSSSDKSVLFKTVLCVWDLSLVMREPLKLLVATEIVTIGRFRGGADGILVTALTDGTIHLWDLSEQAAWMANDVNVEKTIDSVEIDSKGLTQTELDRQWNRDHDRRSSKKADTGLMQLSAYTSSGTSVLKNDPCDRITGLEFMGDAQMSSVQDGGRKIVAQFCSLQQAGILTLYSVVQDRQRCSTNDIGKAFWSKLALEILQKLNLAESLDLCIHNNNAFAKDTTDSFDLNAAKRRLSVKWREKERPLSANRRSAGVARPRSARTRVLPASDITRNSWETGLVCYDLKIVRMDSGERFLIAKNCGEVLSCTRYAGVFRINRFSVANDTSSITRLQVSQNGLLYFVAATETGSVSLCSVQELRVLLTLDCRNKQPTTSEKYNADTKGRFVGCSTRNSISTNHISGKDGKMAISSLVWSPTNPFEVGVLLDDGALVAWRLTTSDIEGRRVEAVAATCATSSDTLALVTTQNEVQVYRLKSGAEDNIELFKKYTSLL